MKIALREELEEIKRKEQAQGKEIVSLRKMIIKLQREIRSLKEGFGPYPVMESGPPPTQKSLKIVKMSPMVERKLEGKDKGNIPSLTRLEATESSMEVEPLVGNTPGCTLDEEYMERDKGWPSGNKSISWMEEDTRKKEEIPSDIIRNKAKTNIKTNMYKDSVNLSDKSYSKSYDKKSANDNARVESTPRGKGIRLIENRQIAPPAQIPLRSNSEWIRVTGKGRRETQLPDVESDGKIQRRRASTGKESAIPGKRLIKPAVVTITSKPDGLTYAEILAKAREKVCLKDLGIKTTTIRRAINRAIVIEVPGPQGKQLADT